MKGRRSERINLSKAELIGIFKENSGTSENEWSDTEEDDDDEKDLKVSDSFKKRIKLITSDQKNNYNHNHNNNNNNTPNLQIKLKIPRKKSPTPTNTNTVIKLPKDMDPEPVCPICLKIIIGDLDEINEHVDECIGPSSTTGYTSIISSQVGSSGTVTPTSMSTLVNVDEDDFGYGKGQYTEEDIENIMKSDALKQKKITSSQLAEDQIESKNSLLIQSILSTSPPSSDFSSLQTALKSLLDRISTAPKCALCWDTLKMPATVSVNCWHVCCEGCWLRTLGTKRLCPHCSAITNPSDLRKVYF